MTVDIKGDSLVLLGHTTIASPAMLASKRLPDHTDGAKVLFVEHAVREEFVNDIFLLPSAAPFWNKAGIGHHRQIVKICTETKGDGE